MTSENKNISILILVSIVAGFFVGIIGGAFHYSIEWLYSFLLELLLYLRLQEWLISPLFLVMIISGACLAAARALVRLSPEASGSGIQHVEAVFKGLANPAPLKTLPIKFIGGLLAMAPGTALGREGPTVQMAAIIGTYFGKLAKLNLKDQFTLYSSVAGAGLAVAFNAPLSGIAFVLEEVSKKVTIENTLIVMAAVASSIFSFWYFFGNDLNFKITITKVPDYQSILWLTTLGVLCGSLGAFYNKSILWAIQEFNNYPKVMPEIRAGLVGSIIGIIVWNFPFAAGGGEVYAQNILNEALSPGILILLLFLRWIMGPLSYSAGTPGGLFAPILLLGAVVGSLFACGLNEVFGTQHEIAYFGLVGMSALFAGVVRAPLTGVLLVTEMTNTTLLIVPLLSAAVAAVLTANLMKNEPIYDSLLKKFKNTPRKSQ